LQALARQFQQAETRNLCGLHAGAVVTQRIAQAVFDLALVTAFVHISGPYNVFAALYILVIAVPAVLLPLWSE